MLQLACPISPRPFAASSTPRTPTTPTRFCAASPPDGTVDDWGREFTGPDAIRGWSDAEFIGKRVTLDLRGVERDGDATVVTAEVGGDGFNGPSHFGFTVDGDRVARMTIRA